VPRRPGRRPVASPYLALTKSTQTTHIYEHADPALKEQAIARTAPLGTKPGRYRPSDTLLAFLEGL
jgi:integrase/recombinase XerD